MNDSLVRIYIKTENIIISLMVKFIFYKKAYSNNNVESLILENIFIVKKLIVFAKYITIYLNRVACVTKI